MSHLARTSMVAPMPYKPEFDQDEMKTVKLKYTSWNNQRKKNVPIFSGKEGIEGLLHVEESVREAWTYLNLVDGNAMFSTFNEALSGNAARKWKNTARAVPTGARTNVTFDEAVTQYYRHFIDDKAHVWVFTYSGLRKTIQGNSLWSRG